MADPLRKRFRPPAAAVLLVALLLSVVAAAASPAAAEGFGWFGNLFGRDQPQSADAPHYPGYGDQPDPYRMPRRRAQRRKQPGQTDQAQDQVSKPKAPTKTATVFVDVFGDSFGQLLANGLDDALADKPEVGIGHMAKGSTGLVNDTYYDWPKAIDDMLAHQGKRSPAKVGQAGGDSSEEAKQSQANEGQVKPASGDADAGKANRIDVAVMMIGSNDRQPFLQDGKKITPGSDDWTAIYRKRVIAIAEAFQKRKIPLIWVGVPIVKNDDFADDMAALNDIYRDAAARTGAIYIDTWEAFSDDSGAFAAYGPDVNGQTVRLRSADGIYFTKAGARKLAHFVEAQVRRDLDGKTPLPELPTADAPQSLPKDAKAGKEANGGKDTKDGKDAKAGKAAVAVVKPEAGPIKNLVELPAAKDGQLGEVTQFRADATRDALLANSLIKGQAEAPPAGRADDFRWPAGSTPAH